MKSIRIWFKKTDTAKYISHLDLSRCMARAIHKAKLPFWYTEGFNPHVFLTITMPISLGYSGLKESMDVKLLDDDMPYSEIIEKLNSGLPIDIQAYEITEQVMKPGAVAFSHYIIKIPSKNPQMVLDNLNELLSKDEILVSKRTKKGMKEIDIKKDFVNAKFELGEDYVNMDIILQSSNVGSINPQLFFDSYQREYNEELFPEVTRINCFDENMAEYK